MFYSETLLSKTGPLARVWLSANLERKLSKTHILQSDIESSVSAIVDQGQAPMALRLSGQLLLGVVRIYSRKARYLLDDCNEALMKIKMAFRPGNVDLPANQTHASNAAALTLPDVLTELDLLPPMPDPSLLLLDDPAIGDLGGYGDISLLTGESQLLPESSIERGRHAPPEATLDLDDLDLGLDFGDAPLEPVGNNTSIEVGRRHEGPARSIEDDLMGDDLKEKGGLQEESRFDLEMPSGHPRDPTLDFGNDDEVILRDDDQMDLGGGENYNAFGRENTAPIAAVTPGRLQRDSLSPLSSIRSSVERELEQELPRNFDLTIFEPTEEEVSVRQAHKSKKRKVLQPDADTMLHQSQIKRQQEDRSHILRPASFLPRDPMILTLMAMQRNGGFVSSILGDGRGKGWAPELKGILSLEVVRRSGELKRKRDSGIADIVEGDDRIGAERQPMLDIGEEEELEIVDGAGAAFSGDTTLGVNGETEEIPAEDEGMRPPMDDDEVSMAPQTRGLSEEDGITPAPEDFDDTAAPLIDPADSGPVSLGTKHAVHLLRDRFGADAADSPSQQRKANVLFQDLLPEDTTSKADATKMFFEVLVLATKDAIKVEQAGGTLGGPIRVRGKRALWGSWAETEAGGEIELGVAPSSSPGPGPGPGPAGVEA
ncbi:MAG: sister chromatid cohesion protein 1 [Pycnora praestabilis]|nr:MAG: sister chromatid cohesion protein 1 [Pycnora praestabilis]